MTDGLVSVVIPTYYRNDRLQAAVESARAQTYEPTEIIVVDGSGERHARPVVIDDADVTYLPQSSDEGPQAARSLGAECARGEYVQFLDDDDRLHPEKLERQVPILESDPDVGVVYCGLERESGGEIYPDPAIQGDVLEDALRATEMLPCLPSTMVVDADALELPLSNRHGADDIGFKIELATRTEFAFVDRVLVTIGEPAYRLHATQAAVDGGFEVLREYADYYAEYPEIEAAYRTDLYRKRARLSVQATWWSARAIRAQWRAIQSAPDRPLRDVAVLLAMLGGRPVYGTGRWLLSAVSRPG